MKKLIPIVIILLVLGLGGYKFYQYKHPDPVSNVLPVSVTAVAGKTDEAVMTSSNNTTSTAQSTSSTTVQTDPPINGIYKGVVEVGASGFNAFVVNVDKDKNWELVYKKFGKSLAWEGFANADDIYAQTKDYISDMAEKGVAGRNIHFVVSSGAAKVPGIERVIGAIKKKGFEVNTVTADQEGKFALKAAMPKAYRANCFVVDIGSGNTKISWFEDNGNLKTVECPGAKYYALGKSDMDVYSEVTATCNKIPTNKRAGCFMIGGVPYKLAEEVRNGNERFTSLKSPDDYSAGDDVKKKSGLNIYRAIYETTKAQNYIFDWDANFTIGFLLSMN